METKSYSSLIFSMLFENHLASKYCLLFVSPLRYICSINIVFHAATRRSVCCKLQMLVMPFCWRVYMASTSAVIVLEFCDVCLLVI